MSWEKELEDLRRREALAEKMGGAEVAYRADLERADDPAAELSRIKAKLNAVTSPFRTAEQFLIEDIIDPRDTRGLLCEFAEMAWGEK